MIAWALAVALLLLAYLGAWTVAGGWGVLLVWLLCGTLATLGLLGRQRGRDDRRTRRIVYRRWAAWEFEDWLRRHTNWRKPS